MKIFKTFVSQYENKNSFFTFRNFGSQPNVKRIQPPSPAYNRDPKYSDSLYGRIKCPSPQYVNNHHNSNGISSAANEMRDRQVEQQINAEIQLRDQQELEKERLEEILAMCVEYERQSSRALDQQNNR